MMLEGTGRSTSTKQTDTTLAARADHREAGSVSTTVESAYRNKDAEKPAIIARAVSQYLFIASVPPSGVGATMAAMRHRWSSIG